MAFNEDDLAAKIAAIMAGDFEALQPSSSVKKPLPTTDSQQSITSNNESEKSISREPSPPPPPRRSLSKSPSSIRGGSPAGVPRIVRGRSSKSPIRKSLSITDPSETPPPKEDVEVKKELIKPSPAVRNVISPMSSRNDSPNPMRLKTFSSDSFQSNTGSISPVPNSPPDRVSHTKSEDEETKKGKKKPDLSIDPKLTIGVRDSFYGEGFREKSGTSADNKRVPSKKENPEDTLRKMLSTKNPDVETAPRVMENPEDALKRMLSGGRADPPGATKEPEKQSKTALKRMESTGKSEPPPTEKVAEEKEQNSEDTLRRLLSTGKSMRLDDPTDTTKPKPSTESGESAEDSLRRILSKSGRLSFSEDQNPVEPALAKTEDPKSALKSRSEGESNSSQNLGVDGKTGSGKSVSFSLDKLKSESKETDIDLTKEIAQESSIPLVEPSPSVETKTETLDEPNPKDESKSISEQNNFDKTKQLDQPPSKPLENMEKEEPTKPSSPPINPEDSKSNPVTKPGMEPTPQENTDDVDSLLFGADDGDTSEVEQTPERSPPLTTGSELDGSIGDKIEATEDNYMNDPSLDQAGEALVSESTREAPSLGGRKQSVLVSYNDVYEEEEEFIEEKEAELETTPGNGLGARKESVLVTYDDVYEDEEDIAGEEKSPVVEPTGEEKDSLDDWDDTEKRPSSPMERRASKIPQRSPSVSRNNSSNNLSGLVGNAAAFRDALSPQADKPSPRKSATPKPNTTVRTVGSHPIEEPLPQRLSSQRGDSPDKGGRSKSPSEISAPNAKPKIARSPANHDGSVPSPSRHGVPASRARSPSSPHGTSKTRSRSPNSPQNSSRNSTPNRRARSPASHVGSVPVASHSVPITRPVARHAVVDNPMRVEKRPGVSSPRRPSPLTSASSSQSAGRKSKPSEGAVRTPTPTKASQLRRSNSHSGLSSAVKPKAQPSSPQSKPISPQPVSREPSFRSEPSSTPRSRSTGRSMPSRQSSEQSIKARLESGMKAKVEENGGTYVERKPRFLRSDSMSSLKPPAPKRGIVSSEQLSRSKQKPIRPQVDSQAIRVPSPHTVISPRGSERHLKVYARVRPFTNLEKQQKNIRRAISKSGDKLILVNPKAFDAEPDTIAAAAVAMDNKQWAQVFHFDQTLWHYDPSTGAEEFVDQETVHQHVGLEIAENILNGVSSSCFAYGHTSTGKTYSLFGGKPQGLGNEEGRGKRRGSPGKYVFDTRGITEESGLIPRVFTDVIGLIARERRGGSDTRMFISFMEIYNEKIRDLLNEERSDLSHLNNSVNLNNSMNNTQLSTSMNGGSVLDALKVREHPVFGPYVENLRKVEVASPREALEIIGRGIELRRTSSTAWNKHSSRSHAVVTLELSSTIIDPSDQYVSAKAAEAYKEFSVNSSARLDDAAARHQKFTRLQMVDLAGSEKDSMPVEEDSRFITTPSKQLQSQLEKEKIELRLIRRSLSTLGYIIKSLSTGASFRGLPYRDSVLTFLLKDALSGGRHHTTMLATISPAHSCYEETLATLRYAERLCMVRSNGQLSRHSDIPRKSLVKSEPDLVESRQALLEEFSKIHERLGSDHPGKKAARQLLQQTVSDPQQRLAKMTKMVYNTEYLNPAEDEDQVLPLTNSPPSRAKSPPRAPANPYPTHRQRDSGPRDLSFPTPQRAQEREVTAGDLDSLKDSYRTLQGELIELQIDLDAVKADRDSLMVDLKRHKEQLSVTDQKKKETKILLQQTAKTLQNSEKELNDLRSLLKTKEDNIERLLRDLSEEKQARVDVEHAYHARTKEFLERFESLKDENKSLNNTLEMSDQRLKTVGEEQREMKEMLEKLRGLLDKSRMEIMDQKATERELLAEIDALKEELNVALTPAVVEEEVNQAKRAFSEHIVKQQKEIETIEEERDYLTNVILQKDQQLQHQQQQAEWSIQMLQQKCAVIENEAKAAAEEDYRRLYKNLQELFNKEGNMMQDDLLDTQKLTNLVKELREKVLQNEFLQRDFDREKAVRKELEKQLTDSLHKITTQNRENIKISNEINQKQMEVEKMKIRTKETQNYSNNNFSPGKTRKPSFNGLNPNDVPYEAIEEEVVKLKNENEQLLQRLSSAQDEMVSLEKEVKNVDNKTQNELSSLWNSVQELNKLDAMKDKSIDDLIVDRDKAINERDLIMEKLKISMTETAKLQEEVESIDKDLLAAVKANSSAKKRLEKRRNQVEFTPQTQHTAMSSIHGSPAARSFNQLDNYGRSPVHGGEFFETDDQISEQLLQRQIEELSDFLIDEEKLKRNRLMNSGGSNHSNSSLYGSGQKTKLYTPTTKLTFDF